MEYACLLDNMAEIATICLFFSTARSAVWVQKFGHLGKNFSLSNFVFITGYISSALGTAESCSFPFTSNGQLYYTCVINNSATACYAWCPLSNNTPVVCTESTLGNIPVLPGLNYLQAWALSSFFSEWPCSCTELITSLYAFLKLFVNKIIWLYLIVVFVYFCYVFSWEILIFVFSYESADYKVPDYTRKCHATAE